MNEQSVCHDCQPEQAGVQGHLEVLVRGVKTPHQGCSVIHPVGADIGQIPKVTIAIATLKLLYQIGDDFEAPSTQKLRDVLTNLVPRFVIQSHSRVDQTDDQIFTC